MYGSPLGSKYISDNGLVVPFSSMESGKLRATTTSSLFFSNK
jgi:hypothetical protein